ncbi:LPS O-antigen chain length determinant protein WzzB [Actinobacillus minor]|uniref:LPS O-antigen chain length determinant protein WzzB n=1 Tax=Actinobacillus minor TaxID=51047 RepID=UPI0023F254D1|nr:Wzz/FepE/Etk N-terminal domain-containing protein [Actinobacillus minor]MDD6911485.1 Wzz/FepE/Etk N-terminal domain-containing protein [Actinobacillus minor]MDY4712427.1 Wzz/FepE/Etk N-terminal domain-containing protein [Actinobacillus minor]
MSSQSKTNSVNDEIDLIELLKTLWDKKIWILISTFVFTVIAGVYAFTAKEQWTSKAEVIAPKVTDLGTYFNVRKEYARILGQEFDAGALANDLFAKFNLLSESLNERNTFFEQSDVYKKLIEGKEEKSQRAILSNLIRENITITKPDPKKEPDLIGRRISFSAETPEDAQLTLGKFIAFTSQSAYQLELENFLINLNEVFFDLTYEKAKFERDLSIQRSVQLENLHNALNIAKEAGIKDYSKAFGATNDTALQAIAMSETKIPLSDSKLSDGTYLFMLGEKYLQAQIDVLTQKGVIYPPRYYQVSELLKELEPLLVKVKEAKANAFSYQASPDYPVVKDKPKKGLLLIIGGVIGLFLSSLCITIFYLIKR